MQLNCRLGSKAIKYVKLLKCLIEVEKCKEFSTEKYVTYYVGSGEFGILDIIVMLGYWLRHLEK